MYSRLASAGGKCNLKPATGATVSYSNNIYFNGTVGFMGTNDKVVDPMFMNITIDGTANFSLKTGSPAIDAGTITLYSLKDILGIARPKGAGVDCGAYEVQ
ncbi:MAG: hypothetical protein H7101_13405 [Deinococcales bacterium]|nr:hypothetical protein [Chitinophagaceae bacterium]